MMKRPVHPGEMLAEEVLAPLGLSVGEAANALGIEEAALQAVIAERAGLDAELAVRLEKAFGSSAEFWLKLQSAFDLARARERAINVEKYAPA